jgi:hypothetical protein
MDARHSPRLRNPDQLAAASVAIEPYEISTPRGVIFRRR